MIDIMAKMPYFFFTFLTAFLTAGAFLGSGGVSSIRRSTSSKPGPLGSGLAGGFTARLATVGQSLSCN